MSAADGPVVPGSTRRPTTVRGARHDAGRRVWDADSLTELALNEFLERGYSATSMEMLARAAGTHKSNFYHHFPGGKQELLQRGLNQALDGLAGVFEETHAREGPARDRLSYVLRRAIEVEFEMMSAVALLVRLRGNSEVERTAMARRRDLTHRLTMIVETAVSEGGIRGDLDPPLTARLMLGVQTSMTEWLQRDGRLDADEIAGAVLDMIFKGIDVRSPS